jgi:ribosomal RNA-processing protein 12
MLQVTGEIILCLKDSNAKTREAGYQLLLAIASRKEMSSFLQVVTAGLGAETSHMRSAAVMALSRVVFEFAWEDESLHALLPSLLSTVLVLIGENSREVIKSTIGFIRISVAAIPLEQLTPLLPELVRGLLHYHKAKTRFRSKIKIVLKKLVKIFGYDALTPLVPDTETRLLTHMRKLDERLSRKKAAGKVQDRELDVFNDMIESDEDDSDDGRTLMTGATGFTKLTARSGGTMRSASAKSGASRMSRTTALLEATGNALRVEDKGIRLPDEADGGVIDILDSKFAKRDSNEDDSDTDNEGMEFDVDGRLVVPDEASSGAARNDEPTEQSPRKKCRISKFGSVNEHQVKKGSGKRARELGTAYKSRKAGGDVRKKGQKFEPYAFVPLDGKSYSKKNRRGAVEQMSSVVRKGGKRKRG